MDGPCFAVDFSTVSLVLGLYPALKSSALIGSLPLYQEWSKLRCGGVSPEGLPVPEFFGREGCLFV